MTNNWQYVRHVSLSCFKGYSPSLKNKQIPLQPIHPSIVKLFPEYSTVLHESSVVFFLVPKYQLRRYTLPISPFPPPKVHKEALQDVVFRSFQGQLCEAILCWSCRQVSLRQEGCGGGLETAGVKGRGPGEVRLTLRNSWFLDDWIYFFG